MLSNAFDYASKNCYYAHQMLLYNIIHDMWSRGGELPVSLNKRAVHAVVQWKIVMR